MMNRMLNIHTLQEALKAVDWATRRSMGQNLGELLQEGITQLLREPAVSAERQEAARLLGVQPDAPEHVVEAARKSWMRRVHPDTHGGDDTEARKINDAAALLSKRGPS